MADNERLILITGATGYVGGRLLRILEERGCRIRCLARKPEYLSRTTNETTEVFQGDVLNQESLVAALKGVETAFYLIHSMGTDKDFESEDRLGARNFAEACRQNNVRRIIYLGGLGDENEELSKHLRSRHEVGKVLRESGSTVIEFRASIIIGSGSLSFDLVRTLVRKLPFMLWPKWVSTEASPIAIEDLLDYLVEAIDIEQEQSEVYEIGGPERISYGGIMLEYARQRGLKRYAIPVPFLSPWLSSLWLGLVTPVYARIGRKLVESLEHPTVVTNDNALKKFSIQPRGIRAAIERARDNEDQEIAETTWADSLSSGGPKQHWGGVKFRNRLVDSRTLEIDLPASAAFAPIQRIGGNTGWYYATWLWKLRGFLDLLVGGIGVRRGRRDPVELQVGDQLDFWRVEAYEPPNYLRLTAEMRLPGRAWLNFEVQEIAPGKSKIVQTAEYDPLGLLGLAYWYSVWPLHQFVFTGMLRNIGKAAEGFANATNPDETFQPT